VEILLYSLGALVLIALNAFFVLAEFAAVKIRSSRIEELVEQDKRGARVVRHIHERLDEYLSVCQVGITVASIAIGILVEPVAAAELSPLLERIGIVSPKVSHAIAMIVGLGAVSALHVTIGEQVPKLIAIRAPDSTSLWTARPLQISRWIFLIPLWLLNSASHGVMRLIGLDPKNNHDDHSEDELRILLQRGHSGGLMSFRRLLFMENVFDFGELKVRDAMRPRASVRYLSAKAPWSDNERVIVEARFSRYPLVDLSTDKPIGIIHIKDLWLGRQTAPVPDLVAVARPFLLTTEDTALESVLTEMQRRRIHVAVVHGKEGRWTGFISMEDIIEEIIGTVEDEFAADPPVYLGDVLSAGRIALGVSAESMAEAIVQVLRAVPASELPMPVEQIADSVLERERLVSTYLGNGIAMPHARLPRLSKPILMFARSSSGVPLPAREEKVHLMFILLTPAGQPRIHQRLQARIAGILDSDYVDRRLREAGSPQEILEAIRTAEQTSLD
jgi:CBS domain containing-hemolysin-like protein